jgi:haloacetate dehalogenase
VGSGPDRAADEADRGRRRILAPVLTLWGERSSVAEAHPIETWRTWADDVRGHGVPAGHFVCEEAAEPVTAALAQFFRT